MNALITGGAGFIGSYLSESLLNQGNSVNIVDDLSTGQIENIAHLQEHARFRYINGSIVDEPLMNDLVKECDVIFHLAAAVGVHLILQDPVRVIETNVLGTHTVLKMANRYDKKVLVASTSEIYGKNNQMPFREDDDRILGPTTKSRWSYSTSKAVDEVLGLAYHKQLGLPVVIFRLFNTIGPRQSRMYGMVVPRFVDQALKSEPLSVYGDGQQSRCFCDVTDTVRGIISLAESPDAVGQVFNIGSSDEVTMLELAHRVIRVVDPTDTREDISDRISLIPYDQAYEEGFEDMRRRVPDTSKIKSLTSWQPRVQLDETLYSIARAQRERLRGSGTRLY